MSGSDRWMPIEVAIKDCIPSRDILKNGRWPCLLQDKNGIVVGGFAAYVKAHFPPNEQRSHKKRPPEYKIQWYAGGIHNHQRHSPVFKPIYWQPMPEPRIDNV